MNRALEHENNPAQPKDVSTLIMPDGSLVATSDWRLSCVMSKLVTEAWGAHNV